MSKKLDNVFIDEPNREVSVRECARLCKLSPSTASKYLQNLVKKGFLKQRKERNLIFYRGNLDSDRYRDLKLYENIRQIRASGLLEELEQKLHPLAIFLFGSYAKAENSKGSDIDIFVISHTKKEMNTILFERGLHAPIQLFVYSPDEMDKMKRTNPHLLNNLINGIRLAGFWEVF